MRRRSKHLALFVRALTVAFAVAVSLAPSPATAADGPAYRPPVDVPVADGFRPPASPYGAGNRGLDYETSPGSPVRAAAAGEVVFAGQVGGSLHVVVLHDDGIRTSYSFLATIDVHRGDKIEQGAEVGTTGATFHFGARAGDVYVDPAVLLAQTVTRVRLVPDDERRPLSEPAERGGVVRMLLRLGPRAAQAGAAASAQAVDWARRQAADAAAAATDELRGWMAYAQTLGAPLPYRVGLAALAWQAAQSSCTPVGTPVPALSGRRFVILVGGLASSSGHAAVLDVDTAALGYAPSDVVQFSYEGGTTADHGYNAADTQMPIENAGLGLRTLIAREASDHPGVPIDVIAHSQGGLVARSALGWSAPPGIGVVITLATPHQGADLATLGAMIAKTAPGRAVEDAGRTLRPGGIDPTSPAVRELAESSRFIHDLAPVPSGVRLLSIGERLDPVVPVPRVHVAGATNVVVHGSGWGNPHSQVTAAQATEQEMRRFLAGQAPTCQSLADAVLDAAAGAVFSQGEAGVGAAATAAGHVVDVTRSRP
jgi:hypothetical protein